jgi:chloramphenicol 3-O phosphotransferase
MTHPGKIIILNGTSSSGKTCIVRALQNILVHKPGIYDLEVDTSRFTAEECASVIKTRIDSGIPPSAFRQIKERLENSTR